MSRPQKPTTGEVLLGLALLAGVGLCVLGQLIIGFI